MKRIAVILLAFAIAAPAYADTDDSMTLIIENDAGSVTQVPGMTQRECDAAKDLLSQRKPRATGQILTLSSGTMTWNGAAIPSSSPHTSALTTIKCMAPADKK